jgi:hypothetical protein
MILESTVITVVYFFFNEGRNDWYRNVPIWRVDPSGDIKQGLLWASLAFHQERIQQKNISPGH